MRSLNVGIIGMGFIAGQHIDAIRRIPGVKVAAISHYKLDPLTQAQEKYFVEKACLDWHEIIEDAEIDVVHNCTPNHLHDDINSAAIWAGKHIYAEKPLSLSSQTAKSLWQLAVSQRVAHGVNYQYRMNAAVQELRERVRSGECGRPLFVSGQYLQESHALKTDYSKRMIPESSPSRALADIGSHWVDTACFVMGQRITQVMADMHTHHPFRIDPITGNEIEIHSDDTSAVMLRFEDGTPGLMMASKVACGHKNDLDVSVYGEQSELRWEQQKPDRLYIGRRERENGEFFMNPRFASPSVRPYVTTPAGHVMGWPEAFRNAVGAFYQSIRDDTYSQPNQHYATFEDGWRVNAFVDACIKSSREKRWVMLDE